MFISNRPLSAVLAALAAAAAFVVTDELYRQHSEGMTETAESSAARCCWLCRLPMTTQGDLAIAKQQTRPLNR